MSFRNQVLWLCCMAFTFFAHVDAGACKPLTLVMTRASAQPLVLNKATQEWTSQYPLSTVNMANVKGALKFVVTEAIDKKHGYGFDCTRKNNASFIHFYKVVVCSPDAALWWFNYREDGYGGDPHYRLGEFGAYSTHDEGRCHTERFCSYYWGNNDVPKLGPFVGFKYESTDVRNPTPGAAWFSLPGECPSERWGEKSDKCKKLQVSGQCKPKETPDGSTCTWSASSLGQVELDELVGIKNIVNPATGRKFSNAQEYCRAGLIEFERGSNYAFVNGLPFWKDILSPEANAERVAKLLELYHESPGNKPLPSVEALKATNPRCYTSQPFCYDAIKKVETCTRNDGMLCVACSGSCPTRPLSDPPFPQLPPIALPVHHQHPSEANDSSDSSDASADASSNSVSLCPIYPYFVLILGLL